MTNTSVEQPLQPFDDDDDRRLIEHGGIKTAQQPWELGHPPQQHARAVRVPVVWTLLLFAWVTAGGAVGGPRWRRQLLEQTREPVIVFAHGDDGVFHLAEYSLLVGGKLTDGPPGIGTRPHVLAK